MRNIVFTLIGNIILSINVLILIVDYGFNSTRGILLLTNSQQYTKTILLLGIIISILIIILSATNINLNKFWTKMIFYTISFSGLIIYSLIAFLNVQFWVAILGPIAIVLIFSSIFIVDRQETIHHV